LYKVELSKKGEAVKDIFPLIRTLSINSARVILVDEKEHMHTLRPGDLGELTIKFVEVVKDGDI
jgi:hypothetical protein